MAVARRPAGRIQLDVDHEFQRRMHGIQRVSWGIMAALLVVALLGLFGSGPLSQATISGGSPPARLEYQRFARLDAPTSLRAWLATGPGTGGAARLRLDHEYLRGVRVEGITPDPARVVSRVDGVDFDFPAGPGLAHVEVVIRLTPERAGRLRGRVDLGDGRSRALTQYVYP